MNLYDNKEIFNQLSSVVALQKGILREAVLYANELQLLDEAIAVFYKLVNILKK